MVFIWIVIIPYIQPWTFCIFMTLKSEGKRDIFFKKWENLREQSKLKLIIYFPPAIPPTFLLLSTSMSGTAVISSQHTVLLSIYSFVLCPFHALECAKLYFLVWKVFYKIAALHFTENFKKLSVQEFSFQSSSCNFVK